MSFFDFIFDNLFIVAIVLIGLFNLFSGSVKKKVSEQERKSQQREVSRAPVEREHPSQRPSEAKPLGRFETVAERLEQKAEELGRKVERKIDDFSQQQKPAKSADEQRQEQMDRLKKEIQQRHTQIESRQIKKTNSSPTNESAHASETIDASEVDELRLNQKLTTSGLIDSVVMAEVLGPPRAMQPYRNIAAKRQRQK